MIEKLLSSKDWFLSLIQQSGTSPTKDAHRLYVLHGPTILSHRERVYKSKISPEGSLPKR